MTYEDLLSEFGITKSPNRSGWISPISCPFPDHDDSTPSFGINVETGGWRCHSRCGKGNIYKFVSKMKGVSIEEAVRYVREKYGYTSSGEKPILSLDSLREKLERSMRSIVETIETIEEVEFEIDKRDLTKDRAPIWWGERGFDQNDWILWDVWYDTRTSDAVFPVRDFTGRTVGTVRRRPKWSRAKYINSESLNKGDIFFGEDLVFGEPHVFLCEGPLDAVWMRHCGFPAMSVLGSYFSPLHRRKLMEMGVEDVTLAFDGDKAGLNAALSVLNERVQADVVQFPDGKDPNDIRDPEELREIVNGPRESLFKFALQSVRGKEN